MPNPFRISALSALSAAACLLLLPGETRCNDAFGMNKIQYDHHTWYYVSTRHFNVYFTAKSVLVGQYAAGHVEAMYDSVSRILGFPLKARVPIILYSTPAEFQQTNIIPYILPEGVGGFTEIFRNRVVIPFDGGYSELHHVLQHEMVHAFMFDRQNTTGNKFSSASQQVPLWFGEGLAEYASLGWDLASEFFMLDAVLFGYVGNPAEEGLPGFLAYKGGQLFWYYLSQTFGAGMLRDWIGAVAKGKDPQAAFKELAHVSLREVGELWLRELRAIYWPELQGRRYGKAVARQLTDHTQDQSHINMQPAISPDGTRIAFFSDREPNVGLHIVDVETEKVGKPLASAGAVRGHLSFYAYQSRITWSPDGKRLAFVSKTGDRDVISVVNSGNGRSLEEIAPPGVRGMLSPAWSPDGGKLAFNGIREGMSNLFIWDLEKKSLTQLTNDVAVDQNPVFSPSGRWIAFESDRNRPGAAQDPKRPFLALRELAPLHDIYRIPSQGGAPMRVAGGPFDEKSPSYGPSDTEMVFVSNRSGINNIYLATLAGGEWKEAPVTNLTGSCYSPSWSASGNLLAFSLFENRGWDIFLMRDPKSHLLADSLPKTRFVRKMERPETRFFQPLPVRNLTSYQRGKSPLAEPSMAAVPRKPEAVAPPASLPPKTPSRPPDTAETADSSAIPKYGPAQAVAGGEGRGHGRHGQEGSAFADGAGGPLDGARADSGTAPPIRNDGVLADGAQEGMERAHAEWADSGQVDLGGPRPRLGSLAVKEYKPKWGLEVASADLGYNTFSQGVAGQTLLTMSDLLGNHRISFMLSSGGSSLRSINALINYDLLPYRTDYGFLAFNFTNYLPANNGFYYFDREYGGGVSARYPYSIFTRFQFDLNGFSTERRLFDAVDGRNVPDSIFHFERLSFVQPSVSWVSDNAEYGMVGPVLGSRMRATLGYVPPVFSDSISFVQADGDARGYWLFWKKYVVAARISLGASGAVGDKMNPQVYLGGGDDLIPFVARTNANNSPVSLPEVVFSQLAVPVRGFRYYEFRGNRKFISNLEFRFPFVETFRTVWPLPITIRYLMGTLFVDYGGAWQSPIDGDEFGTAMNTLGMGYGYGFRLNLGIFVLRYTRAYTVDGVGPGKGDLRSYWALGGEF